MGIAVVLIVVRQSIWHALHTTKSIIASYDVICAICGVSLCTKFKKIGRIDEETYQRAAQASLSEIMIYSNL